MRIDQSDLERMVDLVEESIASTAYRTPIERLAVAAALLCVLSRSGGESRRDRELRMRAEKLLTDALWG